MHTILGKMASLLLLCMLMLVMVPGALAAGNTVNMVANPTLGNILTDSDGRTLYRFTRDTVNVSSACYGQCANYWPPLMKKGKLRAGTGVKAGLLGTTKRKNGKPQVTYKGHPLYLYTGDTGAGQLEGQRQNFFGGKWYALSATGSANKKAPPTGGGTTTSTTTTGTTDCGIYGCP